MCPLQDPNFTRAAGVDQAAAYDAAPAAPGACLSNCGASSDFVASKASARERSATLLIFCALSQYGNGNGILIFYGVLNMHALFLTCSLRWERLKLQANNPARLSIVLVQEYDMLKVEWNLLHYVAHASGACCTSCVYIFVQLGAACWGIICLWCTALACFTIFAFQPCHLVSLG